jgi:hypothetical protein
MNPIDVVLGVFQIVGHLLIGMLSIASVLAGLAIVIAIIGYIFLRVVDYFNDPQRWV